MIVAFVLIAIPLALVAWLFFSFRGMDKKKANGYSKHSAARKQSSMPQVKSAEAKKEDKPLVEKNAEGIVEFRVGVPYRDNGKGRVFECIGRKGKKKPLVFMGSLNNLERDREIMREGIYGGWNTVKVVDGVETCDRGNMKADDIASEKDCAEDVAFMRQTEKESQSRYEREQKNGTGLKVEMSVSVGDSTVKTSGYDKLMSETKNFVASSDGEWLELEKKYRKEATQLKKEKRFDEAVESLRKAREAQYKTEEYWSISTLLRIPEYLMLAKRYQEAYDEAVQISEFKWYVLGMIPTTMEQIKVELRLFALRAACRAALAMENMELIRKCERLLNEIEGEERELNKGLGKARVADIKREFRETYSVIGNDVGQISNDGCTCLPNALLDKWSGTFISVLGKVKGLPTIDDALADGMFCVEDCVHRVDYVDAVDRELPAHIRKLIVK